MEELLVLFLVLDAGSAGTPFSIACCCCRVALESAAALICWCRCNTDDVKGSAGQISTTNSSR